MVGDLIQIGVAFGLFFIAHGLGVLRERDRKPEPPEPPNLHCGCGDELSFHDGLGACAKTEMYYVKNEGNKTIHRPHPCGCQQYTGDLPDDWYSRESMKPEA